MGSVTFQYSDSIAAGIVISQDPDVAGGDDPENLRSARKSTDSSMAANLYYAGFRISR